MKRLISFFKSERVRSWLLIIFGSAIGAAAYPMFLTPNAIAPGGLTGVAMILNHLFRWPIGITSLLLCVPLFLAGWKQSGLLFVVKTVAATVLFSLLIDLLPLPPVTDDILLATVFGAVLLGVGLGMILKGGATTGGTDMMAEMLHRQFPSVRVGVFLACLDGCVILAAALFIGARAALYALINIVICSYVIDLSLSGAGKAKACFIISDMADQISARILHEMDRGVTLLNATGAYSRANKNLIICVCASKEIARLKQIVKKEDEKSFMFITDTHETLGEGFNHWM